MDSGDRTGKGEIVTWGGWNLSYNLFLGVALFRVHKYKLNMLLYLGWSNTTCIKSACKMMINFTF